MKACSPRTWVCQRGPLRMCKRSMPSKHWKIQRVPMPGAHPFRRQRPAWRGAKGVFPTAAGFSFPVSPSAPWWLAPGHAFARSPTVLSLEADPLCRPHSPLGIGCGLDLLMRGDVDLGISINVVIGAAAKTVATCQEIASIRHGSIKYRGTTLSKTEVIRAEATNGRTARPEEGTTDELISPPITGPP
jgi:hypothetical protein